MKFLLVLILIALNMSCIFHKKDGPYKPNILPQPQNIQLNKGKFVLQENARFILPTQHGNLKFILQELIEKINTASGSNLQLLIGTDEVNKGDFNIIIDESLKKLNKEGYLLNITSENVEISAAGEIGIARGIQSLRQLFPVQIENSIKGENVEWVLPTLHIEDTPRFEWRGLLLDCGRHFMSKDFIKRYIDLLAYHKMNVLHWHLTEDQGWRIEIKKYPKLTEKGAWRTYEDGTIYGGFYTQEDIKEIVKYGSERYVTIIPEIELPGHSVAALAAYPEFSCTGGPFEVETAWGVHKDIYCAGNEKTFQFLQDVLDEVVELFPAPYIHIGGDEAPKNRWKECSKCQKRIKKEGLKDEHELQSYFIKRIEKYLSTKNRHIIGWDEILEGGLAPGATLQAWRSIDHAATAVKQGNKAIVSPTSHAYFDYDVSTISLKQVYSFNPIPAGLSKDEEALIIGGECNMWTERAPQETVDSKVFPRILAMAEVLWTGPQKNNAYEDFHVRVQEHNNRLDALSVDYGAAADPVTIDVTSLFNEKRFEIKLISGEPNLDIRYTIDGEQPDLSAKRYTTPLTFGKSITIKAQAFKDDKVYGLPEKKLLQIHNGFGQKIKYSKLYQSKYKAGGDLALVNGITGSNRFRDGNWQGFEKDDMEVVIDLKKNIPIKSVSINCLQDVNSWIFLPVSVQYSVSEDGKKFKPVADLENNIPLQKNEAQVHSFSVNLQDVSGRYLKVFAKNLEICPDWHSGAGGKTWLFVDEIVVE